MSSPSRDNVEALLKKSPYSSSNQATLEAYVDAQSAGTAPYYMDANRSLLKLYQFFPQNLNEDKVSLIMLLALLEFPATDLLALRYLVPDRVQKAEPCNSILACAGLLESCKFAEFWVAFSGLEGGDSVKALVGASKEKMQRAIIEILALTYKTASLAKVLEALNMSSGDEVSKLNHASIDSVAGDKVVFAASSDNTKRDRVFQAGVNFNTIASMMAKVSSE
jgi:translation initiation factor 3 subunit K